MPEKVRYYTTEVPPSKSLAEVAELLREYGAQRFEQMWEAGRTVGIRFNLPTPEAKFGFLPIVMRPRLDHVRRQLRDLHGITDEDQVDRVAWRQLKGILEGILLSVQSGMFSPGQVLLGMSETPDGETLWEAMSRLPSLPSLPAPRDLDGDPPILEAEVVEE